jgi:hypothetical protein
MNLKKTSPIFLLRSRNRAWRGYPASYEGNDYNRVSFRPPAPFGNTLASQAAESVPESAYPKGAGGNARASRFERSLGKETLARISLPSISFRDLRHPNSRIAGDLLERNGS